MSSCEHRSLSGRNFDGDYRIARLGIRMAMILADGNEAPACSIDDSISVPAFSFRRKRGRQPTRPDEVDPLIAEVRKIEGASLDGDGSAAVLVNASTSIEGGRQELADRAIRVTAQDGYPTAIVRTGFAPNDRAIVDDKIRNLAAGSCDSQRR
jgi:hypothetical protein